MVENVGRMWLGKVEQLRQDYLEYVGLGRLGYVTLVGYMLLHVSAHIEKTNSLPAASCEQNFMLNSIGKLYSFYDIFLSIRTIIPVRTVL